MTRYCRLCQCDLPQSEFGRDSHARDGISTRCRMCERARVRDYRERNPERAYEARQRTYKRHAEKRRANARAWKKAHPEIANAHERVRQAVETGRLIRPEHCEHCGVETKPEAHHEDYEVPLEVRWLCVRCHRRLHKGILEDPAAAAKRARKKAIRGGP